MSKLYEITERLNGALLAIEEGHVSADDMADTLDGLGFELKEKIEGVVMYRENELAVAKQKKELAKKLNDEAKAIEARVDNLMGYVELNMLAAEQKTVECDYFTVKFQKNPPRVNISDEGLIDAKYIKSKVVESVDKNLIKDDLKNGKAVLGAELVQDERLVIK